MQKKMTPGEMILFDAFAEVFQKPDHRLDICKIELAKWISEQDGDMQKWTEFALAEIRKRIENPVLAKINDFASCGK